jgi:hypothetical protein
MSLRGLQILGGALTDRETALQAHSDGRLKGNRLALVDYAFG